MTTMWIIEKSKSNVSMLNLTRPREVKKGVCKESLTYENICPKDVTD